MAAIGISALEGLIADVLKIDSYSFLSLVETRVLLEVSTVRLACERRTDEDLNLLESALRQYLDKAMNGVKAVDEDFMFHLAIAEASKNKVLKSLLLIIVPDILSNYSIFKVCDTPDSKTVEEHKQILSAIQNADADGAALIMQQHLRGVMEFARALVQ